MKIKEDIVISGISGRFPECESVEEFRQKLLDGIDLITSDGSRWSKNIQGMPARTGKLKHLNTFDAEFFGVHSKQAHTLDPQQRLLLETTFEAILDAGINPSDIRGSNTGVFVGTWQSEASQYWKKNLDNLNSYGLLGTIGCLFSNRISYAFDLHGPSITIDTACSSSLVALENAINAIQSGVCDAAIAAGSNICLTPHTSMQLSHLGLTSPEGKCATFDSSGRGFARSEGIAVVYLQKASSAFRIYASILGSKVNSDGYTPQGVSYPCGEMQYQLLSSLYKEIGVNVNDVEYIEAHGTGTEAGDEVEGNALTRVFCQNRPGPLLIGSVKSNMGHSESAAGLASVIKVVLAMECGVLPPNLHFKNPHPKIPALVDGRLKVVTQKEEYKGGVVGISSFGIGGTNCHIVLCPHLKQKVSLHKDTIPRLVVVSGRTELSAINVLNSAEAYKDAEFYALLNKIHSKNITGHPWRGYRILDGPITEVMPLSNQRRPIWFIYSGLGSQWRDMAKQMMIIEPFSKSIKQSAAYLSKLNLNLMDLLISDKIQPFDEIVNAFVTISVIQIALTDVLKEWGIEPDGIIGHSLGEVVAGYADGCLTAEEAAIIPLLRANAFNESDLAPGLLASVGLTWDECKIRCPSDVFPACHNSKDNVTISGPAEPVEKFVKQLQSENIFAKVVPGSKHAYHTKHITPARTKLMETLTKVLDNPKKRSSKWISTSVPQEDWGSSLAQTCSAAYMANNLESPVLFYEALQHIPDNAITIEIAPHGLMMSILKRALSEDTIHLSLMKRSHEDNVTYLLSTIGKLFCFGHQPNISKIYSPVHFPVGHGTPMIAPLIQWDHSDDWFVVNAAEQHNYGEQAIDFDLAKEEHSYLSGHYINGRVLFPGTGYLVLVWKTLAKLKGINAEEMPVIFEDVNFHRATPMPKSGNIQFVVNIFRGTGDFEVCESGSLVASGKIKALEKIQESSYTMTNTKVDDLPLCTKDIYTDFRLRGYGYRGLFKGIIECDKLRNNGTLQWNNNWTAFLDTVLQFYMIGEDASHLHLLGNLRRVIINPSLHRQCIEKSDALQAYANHYVGMVKSGGVEITGMGTAPTHRSQRLNSDPKLETYGFLPFIHTVASEEHALVVLMQTVLENIGIVNNLNILEIPGETSVVTTVKEFIENVPMYSAEVTVLNPKESTMSSATVLHKDIDTMVFEKPFDLLILADATKNSSIVNRVNELLKADKGFLLLIENVSGDASKTFQDAGFEIISVMTASKCYSLMKKPIAQPINFRVINVNHKHFEWVELLKSAIQDSETTGNKIYLVDEEGSGLVGLINCLKKEPGGGNIRGYILPSSKVKGFKPSLPLYSAQVKKDLVHNILNPTQVWGALRLLPIDSSAATVLAQHAYIKPMVRGDFSSLKWMQSPMMKYRPPKNFEICTIDYAGINFRDVMLASGKLPPSENAQGESFLGFEFSGHDSTGKRVMGLLEGNCMSTTCAIDKDMLFNVPDDWSLEEAASVPIVYSTCYYGLITRGRMQPGESILIHAGAGGVGIAAITLALYMKCTVFTTVGSQEKRDFLKKLFPQLDDNHIGNSRDTSFEYMIMTQTKGRGVDIVLNSLTGEMLLASARCVAIEGRFLELGKADLVQNAPLGLGMFLGNRSFIGVSLDEFPTTNIPLLKQIIGQIRDGIKAGAVKPLPITVYPDTEVEQAFRLIGSGKHTGKVILKIPNQVTALRRIYMDSCKSYIVVGGLGGFGLQLVNWMIVRGARKVIITSRNGVKTSYQSLCLHRWKTQGVNVTVSLRDVSIAKEAENLLNDAQEMGPVGGIFNLALVINDALIQNQTPSTFASVANAKITTTENLDISSRRQTIASSLEHFVLFSSAVPTLGSVGQSNYGLANSAAEKICERRHADGLPAVAIQWGAIGDVGYFSEMVDGEDVVHLGLEQQKMPSCFATLDVLLPLPYPVVSSIVVAKKEDETVHQVEVGIAEAVGRLLGIKDINKIAHTSTLVELGMDSFVGVEVKQMLERNYNIIMTIQEMRSATLQHLTDLHNSKTATGRTVFIINPPENFLDISALLDKHIPVCILETPTNFSKLKEVQAKGPYTILGYSGAAIELGLNIEISGEKANVIILGNLLGFRMDSQTKALEYFASHLLKDKLDMAFVKHLSTFKTSSERIAYAAKILSQSLPISYEDAERRVSSFWNEVLGYSSYKPSGKFKGDVVLIKSRDKWSSVDDDGINLACNQKINVILLDGIHKPDLPEETAIKLKDIITSVVNKQ